MNARAKALTATAAAVLLGAAGLYAATVHPVLGGPGAAAAFSLWMVGRSYTRQHQRAAVECEQARRAAVVIPDPRPMPDWEQLTEQDRINQAIADMEAHWNEEAA